MIIHWNDADVDVHFTFTAGYPARLTGDPDSWEPGCPDDWEITLVDYEGVDVLPLFSGNDYEKLLGMVMEKAEEERRDVWI